MTLANVETIIEMSIISASQKAGYSRFKEPRLRGWCPLNVIPRSGAVPGECKSYNVLNEPGRYWSSTGHPLSCDKNLTSGGWYRFQGPAGKMMATHCIPRQSCNSRMVGWIGGGDHPTIAYQKVTRTVYMHHKSSCQFLSYPGTDIRNCSGFYVYKLKSTTTCFQRYCGVNDENDACSTNPGSTACICPSGYSGTPCRDNDECTTGSHNCHSQATCTNTPGAFTCSCTVGFTGNGVSCSDIDECTDGAHDCHQDADCENTEGEFTCSCKQGFTGDGRLCTGKTFIPSVLPPAIGRLFIFVD
ncbi:hypothetical protein pdam_00023621 [Pocillopora damicornis]|uniref:EGF-like domain-containing protein n=1 Tax=Pocillopora damicornis TaxID=46731 RepID=A0A3M6TQL6_POCDA|nr:hypothetical protein pdam_00023621 [Pocillopora damicornis]